MIRTPISADSHITEPPNCYIDYIDPAFRDRAPVIKELPNVGDAFVIEGMATPVPLGLLAAAGKEPSKITTSGVAFKDLWRSGWDPKYRLADQDSDGVAAEIIHPTVGMRCCATTSTFDFKKAWLEAYNRWLAEHCSEAGPPARLGPGLDEHARRRRRPAQGGQGHGIQRRDDARRPGGGGLRQQDLRPAWGDGGGGLGSPLSFHILTTKSGAMAQNPRGPRINSFLSIIRGCQDIMGTADLQQKRLTAIRACG